MSARSIIEIRCNCEKARHGRESGHRCPKTFTDYATRAWKARAYASANGWKPHKVTGPRGGQDTEDYCPECRRSCDVPDDVKIKKES
jgi:hypothetical protein